MLFSHCQSEVKEVKDDFGVTTDTLCQLMFESIDCDNGMQRN